MRQLSEKYWAAGWLLDLGFILWEELLNPMDTTQLTTGECLDLLLLAKEAGVWFKWDLETKTPIAIDLVDWMVEYAETVS
jgi:hypothetical protein